MTDTASTDASLLLLSLQFLCDALDADILSEVAEASAATRYFLYVGFGEPAPLPVGQPDAFHPTWRHKTILRHQPAIAHVRGSASELTVTCYGLGVKDVGLFQR